MDWQTVLRAAGRETGILARKRQNLIGHALCAAPEGRIVPEGAFVCLLKSAPGTQLSAVNLTGKVPDASC
jgi:hypothetical protein